MTMPADFASPAVDESSPRYDGWRVTAVCFVVAMFCWGFGLYSHGIYLAELQRLFGWSTSLISGATTAHRLVGRIRQRCHRPVRPAANLFDRHVLSWGCGRSAGVHCRALATLSSRPLRSRFEGWPNCEDLE